MSGAVGKGSPPSSSPACPAGPWGAWPRLLRLRWRREGGRWAALLGGPCANPCGASRPSRPLPALQQNGSALCSFARSLFLFCHLPVAKHCWEPHVGDAAALFQAQEAAAAAAQGLGRSTRLPVRLPEPGRNRGRSGRGAQLLPQPCPRRPGVRLGSAQTEPAPGGVWGEGGAPALAVRAPKQRGLGKLRPRVSAAPEAQGQAVGNAGGMGRGRGDAPDPARVGGDGGGGPLLPWRGPWLVLGLASPLPFLGARSPVPSSWGSMR